MKIQRTPIALAVGALLAVPLAMAQDNLTESYSVSVTNSGTLAIDGTLSSTTTQTTNVTADIPVGSKAQAVVDDKQIGSTNAVNNNAHDNASNIGGTVGNAATGNIGVNVGSGDNNMQDNAAAIAASDAYFVFGAAESRAMTTQLSTQNVAVSVGSNNNAVMEGGFAGAAGNIGINVTAGNGNMQKNNLAISSAPSRASVASVQNVQRSRDNSSTNAGTVELVQDTVDITLSGPVTGTYAGTASGTMTGTADQVGNVYLDTWSGDPHPNGDSTGHVDVDDLVQGAQDPAGDGGAFLFNTASDYAGTESGNVALTGSFTGQIVTTNAIVHQSQNNARLSGDALAGASGNIGVNVSSGNGNLQNNSLSVAISHAPVANGGVVVPPPNGGGEQ